MPDTLTLGGKITLTGFSGVDGGSMIVLKKVIGNYAKRFSESAPEFQSLDLVLDGHDQKGIVVGARVVIGEKDHRSRAEEPNIFVAVDKALKHIEKDLGVL